jgi:metallophosphoesterase superfamily enzyme
LQEFERQMIHDLVKLVPEWIWIMGNHDSELPTGLWGMKLEDLTDMPFSFYHQPNAYDQLSFQIVGHYHPKYTTSLKGRHLSKPCFAWSQSILIMPSFGSYTGGLRVDHPEIIKVLDDAFQIATADTIPRPILITIRQDCFKNPLTRIY